MTVQNVIDSPFIFRPKFTREEISLKSRRVNERRFVPSVLVPHTIEASLTREQCVLKFEYLIDETPENKRVELDKNISLSIGEFTDKVLELNLKCSNLETLLEQLDRAEKLLGERKGIVERESVKRNYDLAAAVLRLVGNEVSHNPDLRSIYSELQESTLNQKAA